MPVWAIAIRSVLALLLLRRLAADAAGAWRGETPATRLVVPSVVLLAALLVANHLVPRPVAAAALFGLDVAFFAICIGMMRSLRGSAGSDVPLERRIEGALLAFFPFWFARFAATDVTIVAHAYCGLKAFIDPGAAHAKTYVHGSKIVIAGAIVAASVVPDALFFWLLLPHHLWWLAVLLDVLDVWAVLWLFGIYGTMVRRPHEISPHRVVFRNGILQTVEVEPGRIKGARVLGEVKKRKLPRRRGDGSTVVAFGGVPIVEVTVEGCATEHRHFAPAPRSVERIFVATDAPAAFCGELEAAASQAAAAPAM